MKKLFPFLYGLIGFLCNCILQVLLCAFISWLISLTFLGTWISDALFTVIRPIELYKIGANRGKFEFDAVNQAADIIGNISTATAKNS